MTITILKGPKKQEALAVMAQENFITFEESDVSRRTKRRRSLKRAETKENLRKGKNPAINEKDPEEYDSDIDDDDTKISGKQKALSCAKTALLFIIIIITVYSMLAYIIASESKNKG